MMRRLTDCGDAVVYEVRRTGHLCVYVLVLLRGLIWTICLRVGTRLLPLSMSRESIEQ